MLLTAMMSIYIHDVSPLYKEKPAIVSLNQYWHKEALH